MYINTEPKDFLPKSFIVLNFYGTHTCFLWDEDAFVCFPYLQKKRSTPILNILKAPAKIKCFREFSERVFILCYPTGIYKLTHNYEFATLSKAGIELGSSFYEVLTPINGTLVLEDKKQKIPKKLCTINEDNDIYVLSLNLDNTDKNLFEILLPSDCKNSDNFCLLAHGRNIFNICKQNIKIIYNCDHSIKNIIPVQKNQKISEIILQTDTNILILIHVLDKKLKFDKIYVDGNIQSLCAVHTENVLLFAYSDGEKVHYTTKMLSEDSLQEIRCERNSIQNFQVYHSKFIILLNNSRELLHVNIEELINVDSEKMDSYVELKSNMLNGIEYILEVISNKTIELKKLQEEMIAKEDVLKRINLFNTKEHLNYCPDDSVTRILKQIYLVSNFKKVLPKNSTIVKMLKCREKTIFAMKTVKSDNTIVEMPITLTNLSPSLYTTTDLITHRSSSGVWCLIKNYVKDPLPSESSQFHLASDKRKFIKYKLLVLDNMVKNNKVSMEELSRMKREIRTMF